MDNQKWGWIALLTAILLAGFATIFQNNHIYAAVLLTLASIIFIVFFVWFLYIKIPRFLTDTELPKVKAKEIYKLAAEKGGIIHATHIFPHNTDPNQDFAVQCLKDVSSGVDISFNRILLLDSIQEERVWLEFLFKNLPKEIKIKILTLRYYPLYITNIIKYILPRINLIIYRSYSKQYCCLFGLDRLRFEQSFINFAVFTRNRLVYEALLKYFEKISHPDNFIACTSFDEYKVKNRINSIIDIGQAVISKLTDFAENNKWISFLGIFGGIARAFMGITAEPLPRHNDPDVDFLIIINPLEGTILDVKSEVEKILDISLTKITWGPDRGPFYEFSEKNKVNVDIECFEEGDSFYMSNQLLGYSIFRYMMPIYSKERRPLPSFINIPTEPISLEQRWRLVLCDRQGVMEFDQRTKGTLNNTDPRRLCAHLLRNTVWAITGIWAQSGIDAVNHLSKLEGWSNLEEIKLAGLLLQEGTDKVRANIDKNYSLTKSLIKIIEEKGTKYIEN